MERENTALGMAHYSQGLVPLPADRKLDLGPSYAGAVAAVESEGGNQLIVNPIGLSLARPTNGSFTFTSHGSTAFVTNVNSPTNSQTYTGDAGVQRLTEDDKTNELDTFCSRDCYRTDLVTSSNYPLATSLSQNIPSRSIKSEEFRGSDYSGPTTVQNSMGLFTFPTAESGLAPLLGHSPLGQACWTQMAALAQTSSTPAFTYESQESRLLPDQLSTAAPPSTETDQLDNFITHSTMPSSLFYPMVSWAQPTQPLCTEHSAVLNPVLIGSKLMNPLYSALNFGAQGNSCVPVIGAQSSLSSDPSTFHPDTALSPLTRAAAVAAAAAAAAAATSSTTPYSHPSSLPIQPLDRTSAAKSSALDSVPFSSAQTNWNKSHSSNLSGRNLSSSGEDTEAETSEQTVYKECQTDDLGQPRKAYKHVLTESQSGLGSLSEWFIDSIWISLW